MRWLFTLAEGLFVMACALVLVSAFAIVKGCEDLLNRMAR